MKLTFIATFLCSAVCMQAYAGTTPSNSADTLKTDNDRISYSMGVIMGSQLKHLGIDLNTHAYSQGLADALSGTKPKMSETDMQTTLMGFKNKLMAKQAAMLIQMKMKNEKESNAYLAKNKTQPGVITLPDGLQYKVLTQGTGATPAATDTVIVHYSGATIDGKEFDSSYKRGQPITIGLDSVIPGWGEALKLMKEGSTWEVAIPANLAYGDKGAPPVIGPGQALIFKINLITVKKTTSASPTTPPITTQ